MATALAHRGGGRPLDAWPQARLAAAVALGHAFPLKGGIRLRLRDEDGDWPTYGPGVAAAPLVCRATPLVADRAPILLELPLSREVAPSVARWRERAGVVAGWHLRCAPLGGPSRAALTDDGQARAWARQVGDEIRRLWDTEGGGEVHLFLAGSVEFAVLIGQQLRDRHPVHVYYGHEDDGYRLACTLRPEGD